MSDTDDTKKEETPPTGDKPDEGAAKDAAAEAEKWKALARKHEAKAKENADKAKQFDALDEASKTEQQKAADRAAAAEKRAEEAEAKALRFEVAADKGVPANLLSGSTREEMEEHASALIAYREDKESHGKPPGKPTEALRGGGDPTEEPTEMNPHELAKDIPRW